MTQGYGPDNGQQGQWGQQGQYGQGQPEQPPAAPQWGQASPAAPAQQPWGQASPGGYPGSTGYAGGQPGTADGVDWRRVKLLGLLLLIGTGVLLLVRLGINLTMFIGAEDLAASNSGGELGAAGIGSSLANLVLYCVNFLVALVLLGLGIAAAVMGRGRARMGGIVAIAGIVLSAVLFWIMVVLAGVVVGLLGGTADGTDTTTTYLAAGAGILHAVVMAVILGVGAFLVHRTATKKLSA